MIISFDQIPGKELPNFKGGEGEVIAKMYADNLNNQAR